MRTKIRLANPCPIKLHPTFDVTGNFACSHCHKNVVDFTTKDEQAIQDILADENFESCGSYRNVYYAGRLGRWQTALLRRKQRLSAKRGIGWKWAVMPLVLGLILLMGCRTVEGKMKARWDYKEPSPTPIEKKQ